MVLNSPNGAAGGGGGGEGNQYPAIKVKKAVKNLDLLLLTSMCQLGIFLQLRSSYNLVKFSEG